MNTNEITLGTFNDNDIKAIVDGEGNEWLTRNQIAEALGYKNTSKIQKIHDVLVKEGVLTVIQNGKRSEEPVFTRLPLTPRHKTYVYNDAAVVEICLESNKPQAKKFRRWIAKQFRVSTANGEVEIKAKKGPSFEDVVATMPEWMQHSIKAQLERQAQAKKLEEVSSRLAKVEVKQVLQEGEATASTFAHSLGWLSKAGNVHNTAVVQAAKAHGFMNQGLIRRIQTPVTGTSDMKEETIFSMEGMQVFRDEIDAVYKDQKTFTVRGLNRNFKVYRKQA